MKNKSEIKLPLVTVYTTEKCADPDSWLSISPWRDIELGKNVLLQVKHDPLYVFFFRAQTSALLGWTELAELLIASGPYALCSTKVDIN